MSYLIDQSYTLELKYFKVDQTHTIFRDEEKSNKKG